MFKKKNNLLPTTIADYFDIETQPEHSYDLRRRPNNNYRFRSNTTTGKKSIQNEGEILWRDLPTYLKDLESLTTFKKHYKLHLLGTE